MSYEPLPPHLDPRGRHRGRQSAGSSVARPLGRALGALLSISLLVVAGYYWKTYRDINNKVPRVQVAVGQAPTGGGASGAHDIDGKDQNILLVGNDDRSTMTRAEVKALHAGESSGSLATDTMIIIHVPANGSKATLISVPRDSYVDIKGYGRGKINGAYADAYSNQSSGSTLDQRRSAGANLLVSTLQDLTGLTINHYVQVDLLGFYRISNAIGGVPVNLCRAVDDSHRANVAAGLSGGSGLVLSKGKHIIKGVTALEFVRQRHFLPRGDLDRVRRQQYFLTAAFRQVASVGILTKLRSLGNAVEQSVYLDPGLDLTELGSQLQNLRANNIISKTIPTTNATEDGQDVEQVNVKKVQAFIDRLINPAPATPATTGASSTTASGSSTAPSTAATSTPAAIDTKCIN